MDANSMSTELRRELREFRRKRSELGEFHSPDSLARAFLAAGPELGDLEVAVIVTRLDGRSSMLHERKTEYRYARNR